uniref:Cytochrome P450 n=1 Tax=Leersia perrieri TaxID=77586 RepID=A0A0D9XPL1_9ORYZ
MQIFLVALVTIVILIAFAISLFYLLPLPQRGGDRWPEDATVATRPPAARPPPPSRSPAAPDSPVPRHGVFRLQLGRVPAVIVTSATAAGEDVFRAHGAAFAGRPRNAMAERLLYSARDVAFAPYGRWILRKVFADSVELLGTEPVRVLLPWLGWVDTLRRLERKAARTFNALDGVPDKVIDDHRRRRRHEGEGRRMDDDDGHKDFMDVLLEMTIWTMKDSSPRARTPRARTPERFLDSTLDYREQNSEMVPFGGGRRGCPGVDFATTTMEMALASLLYHFNWEVAVVASGKGRRLRTVVRHE